MQAATNTLTIGDRTFRIRWDAGAACMAETQLKRMAREAGATREEVDAINILNGADMSLPTALAFLYGAIYAGAAERDEDAPVSFRKLGSLLDSDARQNEAFAAMSDLIAAYGDVDAEPGKAVPAKPARKSTSAASTRSARSTSASPTASSGG